MAVNLTAIIFITLINFINLINSHHLLNLHHLISYLKLTKPSPCVPNTIPGAWLPHWR